MKNLRRIVKGPAKWQVGLTAVRITNQKAAGPALILIECQIIIDNTENKPNVNIAEIKYKGLLARKN